MQRHTFGCSSIKGSVIFFALLLCSEAAIAAPVIQRVSGSIVHGSSIQIAGAGFGIKSNASPVVWDNASSSRLLDVWDGFWPDNSPTTKFNMHYTTPIRGIALPHKHISKYIAGAHGDSDGYDAGYNVMLFKNRTISSYPAYTYLSVYKRSDDNWSFCGDNNYKVFDYSMGKSPYTMPENWYIEYNGRPTSPTNTPGWHLNDDCEGTSCESLDPSKGWWDSAVNPMSGKWTKLELEIKYTNQSSGYIKLWENGTLKINYSGRTDRLPGSARSEGIGGYARCDGRSNNWRYFADVYLDYSRARIVLTNHSDYTKATIVEPQIPTNWSDGSISANVNLGKFGKGDNAYVFIFDPSGQRNVTGFPIVVGSSGDGAPNSVPDAPTDLRVVE